MMAPRGGGGQALHPVLSHVEQQFGDRDAFRGIELADVVADAAHASALT